MDPAPPPALDTAALRRRLRETEAELERVTLRLSRLESATSMRRGLMLLTVARNPRKGLAELRRGLALALAGRRGRRGRSARPAATSAAAADRLAERLLAVSAVLVATRDRPVLAVVADDGVVRAWSRAGYVQPLRPNDALAVFAALAPDVLVVDAAAGRHGPWSGLGSYAVPERDRTLLEVLRAAHDRGVPAVLVPPETPEEAPLLADARALFTGEVRPGATVADLVAAGRVPA